MTMPTGVYLGEVVLLDTVRPEAQPNQPIGLGLLGRGSANQGRRVRQGDAV